VKSQEPHRTRVFKKFLPSLGLSLEQYTENVPHDGGFYLLLNGEIIASFKTPKTAMKAFEEKRDELGFTPPEKTEELTPEQLIQQERVYMEYWRSEEYWGNAGSFRKGGKLSKR